MWCCDVFPRFWGLGTPTSPFFLFGPEYGPFKHYVSDILFPYGSPSPRPHPDPTPTPPNTPKRTRNGPETEPNGAKRTRTEPNGAEMDRNQAFRGGMGGGFAGVGGVGGCKGKRKSLHYVLKGKWPTLKRQIL